MFMLITEDIEEWNRNFRADCVLFGNIVSQTIVLMKNTRQSFFDWKLKLKFQSKIGRFYVFFEQLRLFLEHGNLILWRAFWKICVSFQCI